MIMMGLRMRWVIGALMFLAGMINYLDRSALGVGAPLVRAARGAREPRALLVIPILFGMGEGPIGSTFNKTVRNWFPHGQQASAVSVANAGTPLGAAVSGPGVGVLALNFGWRVAFVIITLIGIAWTIAWFAIATDRPSDSARVSAEEL